MNAISHRPSHFDASNRNLEIWMRNEATDPSATTPFRRARGFSGTAINTTYVLKRLTAEFGPIGQGFGVEILAEDILEGAPVRTEKGELLGHEKVHRVRINFWWRDPISRERCSFHQVGQTTFVGRDKNGWFTDEEAPKKSTSDAVLKAASWVGIGADIHMGLYDDQKYLEQLAAEERAAEERARVPGPLSERPPKPPQKPDDKPSPGIQARSDDPLREKVDAAVQAFAAATSAARVWQLKKAAGNGLATAIREAGAMIWRRSWPGRSRLRRSGFHPPANDEPPFADMPEWGNDRGYSERGSCVAAATRSWAYARTCRGRRR